MSLKTENTLENQHINSVSFLAHPEEPIDRYAEYLTEMSDSISKLGHSSNLFDNSNETDRKWFKIARKYLSRLQVKSHSKK